MNDDVLALRKQLQQLAELHAGGALGDAAYQESRAKLERRLVDAVMSTPGAAAAAPSARVPAKLLSLLAVAVLVIAAAGYWWTGSPERVAEAVPANEGASAPAGQPHAMSFEQIAAMADKLAERLKVQPDDAEGWAMLARSYAVLGRNPEAVDAYKKATALNGEDASLLADYADALAVQNKHSLNGEPAKLIARALKLDPDNPKALSLAGTEAFDRKDYAAAAKHWERVVQVGPADSALVQQAKGSAAEARELGKLPALSLAPPAAAAAPASASVSGNVMLAPALAKQASPGDTVFVFARAAEGGAMPLAVLRKQVKDLPLDFKLDDSLAMAPTAKLSGAAKVIVSARVSKSGDAIPQAGDLSGQSAPVAVGASGLRIEINTVVK
jgi:cytochrome c-type biogenesis protein CcmH